MRFPRIWSLVVASAVAAAVAVPASASSPVYRAFSASSWWNVPLPADAPVHPDSAAMISFLKTRNVEDGCPLLAGAGSNRWGTPVYWAQEGDPTYAVETVLYDVPPEFASLRIPAGARPADNDDAEMVVFDRGRGYVAWLHDAVYDAAADRWTVEGGSIAYLGSNGLHTSLARSDEPRNTGSHRGLNGAVVAARYDEVSAGAIDHVLRIGVSQAAPSAVFPMTGSDGRSTDPFAPPQGTRIRIKPGIDLSRYDLHPEARTIATALQRYGAVIGDTTGAPVELKLEDTVSQGRGQLWGVGVYALCTIPLDAYEVVEHGYVPPPDTTTDDSTTDAPADDGVKDGGTTSRPGGRDADRPRKTAKVVDTQAVCEPAGEEPPFPDVQGTHAEPVACVAHHDIAGGYPDGTYRPDAMVTRGQMATFVARSIAAAGGPALPPGDGRFTDTEEPHADNIERLAAADIVSGYPDGTYQPQRLVSRSQMAVYLTRAHAWMTDQAVAPDGDYFDDDAHATEDAIDTAATLGLTGGTAAGPRFYEPGRSVTRAQMASFLARLLASAAD